MTDRSTALFTVADLQTIVAAWRTVRHEGDIWLRVEPGSPLAQDRDDRALDDDRDDDPDEDAE